MKALIPRFHFCRWGGADVTGDGDCTGRCVAVQWLGLIVEFAVGVVR